MMARGEMDEDEEEEGQVHSTKPAPYTSSAMRRVVVFVALAVVANSTCVESRRW